MVVALAPWQSLAHAGTPWVVGDPARNTLASMARRIADPSFLRSAARLQFDIACTFAPARLTPATLVGVQATPLGEIWPLRCNLLSHAPNAEAGKPVLLPEPRAIRSTPTGTNAPAGDLFDSASGKAGDTLAPIYSPDVTGHTQMLVDPSAQTRSQTDCEEGDTCDPPDDMIDARQSSNDPDAPAAGLATIRIGAYLLIWLVLLCLSGLLCLIYYKRRLAPEAKLIRAAKAGLKRGEFRVEYQPVVSLREGKCVGVEALIRWENKEYGALGPLHYMSCLEHTTLIGPLTRFVLSTAAREFDSLMAASSLYIGVNVCVGHVASKTFVSDVCESAKGILSQLILHITQSHCEKPAVNVLNALGALREKEVRFALACQGTGPVDPRLLAAIEFEMVKIDRQVLALDEVQRRQRLAEVIEVARSIGASVVAAGVESAAHHSVVERSGADFGQGFFYGRTMVINLLRTFLEAGGTPVRARQARLGQ
jgi:c-di-GMP phosphodiesterase